MCVGEKFAGEIIDLHAENVGPFGEAIVDEVIGIAHEVFSKLEMLLNINNLDQVPLFGK